MKENTKNKNLISLLPKITFGLTFILLIHAFLFSYKEDTKLDNSEDVVIHDTMYLEGVGEVETPYKMTMRNNVTYEFKDTIPEEIGDNYAMMLYSMYAETKVIVDGKVIGEYGVKRHMPMGHVVGNIRIIIPIDESMAGKEVTIKVLSHYTSPADYNAPVYGSKDTIWKVVLRDNICRLVLLAMMCTLIIMVLGLMVYQTIFKANIDFLTLAHFEQFIICVTLWILCSSDIPQFFTSANDGVALTSFMCLSLLGVAYMGFCERIFTDEKKHFELLKNLGWMIPILNIVCYFIGISDPMNLLPLTHVYYLVISVYSVVYSVRHYRKNVDSKILCIAICILVAFSIVGLLAFYLYPSKGYDALTFGTGLLIFFYALFAIIIRKMVKMVEGEKNIREYQTMAFEDVLTGLNNRSSFEYYFNNLDEQKIDNKSVTLFMFDLNYLKVTNDTYGHKAGDELLEGLGTCIKTAFGKYGSCYRLGGDEFAAVVIGHADRILDIIEQFNDTVDAYNKRHMYKVSTSLGYATGKYTEGDVDFFNKIFRGADDMMYANKEHFHQKNGTDIRNKRD